MVKQCIICGMTFESSHNAKTCSRECGLENKRRNARKSQKANYVPSLRRPLRAQDLKAKDLDKDIAEAKKQDISYGEYKARQFLAEEKASRNLL